MKTFAYQSQTNLLGKRVAFMKQLIATNCGNKVRVNSRCCLHLRVSAVVNVDRMPAGTHNVQSNASFYFLIKFIEFVDATVSGVLLLFLFS